MCGLKGVGWAEPDCGDVTGCSAAALAYNSSSVGDDAVLEYVSCCFIFCSCFSFSDKIRLSKETGTGRGLFPSFWSLELAWSLVPDVRRIGIVLGRPRIIRSSRRGFGHFGHGVAVWKFCQQHRHSLIDEFPRAVIPRKTLAG